MKTPIVMFVTNGMRIVVLDEFSSPIASGAERGYILRWKKLTCGLGGQRNKARMWKKLPLKMWSSQIHSETLKCQPRGDSLTSAFRVSFSPQLELHSNEKRPAGSGDSKGTTAGFGSSRQSSEVGSIPKCQIIVPETLSSRCLRLL